MRHNAVLLIAQHLDQGGSERQLTEVAKGVRAFGFASHVGAFRPGGMRWRELEAVGIPVSPFPVSSLADLRGAFGIAKYVHANGIRLVHAFDAAANIYAVPAARLAGCGVVLSSVRTHRSLTRDWLRPWQRTVDLLSDGVVVNCEFLRKHLIEEERVPARRIHLCYNGIDTRIFNAARRSRPDRLRDASLVIGVVCGLRAEKGLELLVEAFARVRRGHAGLKLAIVGSGACLPALEEQARALEVLDDCVFEPATPDVPRWLGGMDIFVLPSRNEAFSNSLMEAMSCGCCAIASRVGGLPELVLDGETGLLFEPGDAGSLAAVLGRVVDQPEFRARLACNSMRMVQTRFGVEHSARRMAEIYSLMLSREGK